MTQEDPSRYARYGRERFEWYCKECTDKKVHSTHIENANDFFSRVWKGFVTDCKHFNLSEKEYKGRELERRNNFYNQPALRHLRKLLN